MPQVIISTSNEEQSAIALADREVCHHLPDSAPKRLRISCMPTFLRIDRCDPARHLETSSLHPTHNYPAPRVLICLLVLFQCHAEPPDLPRSQAHGLHPGVLEAQMYMDTSCKRCLFGICCRWAAPKGPAVAGVLFGGFAVAQRCSHVSCFCTCGVTAAEPKCRDRPACGH